MSKFRWMRWIAWAALTCLLVALGVGIYEAQPRQPRWQTAHQPLTPNHERKWIRSVSFDPAGTTLLTFPARRTSAEMRNAFASLIDDASNLLEPAKLGIWDRATGKKLASYPRSAIFTNAANFSKDYHYCASDSQDKDAQYFVTIVDFHKGNEINVPLKERPYSNYLFSPHGDFLVRHDIVQMDDEATPLVIYESVSGRVLDERQSFRVVSFSKDYLLHVVDRKKSHDSVELWSLAAKKPVATLSRNGWFVEDLSSDGRSVIFRKFGEQARWKSVRTGT